MLTNVSCLHCLAGPVCIESYRPTQDERARFSMYIEAETEWLHGQHTTVAMWSSMPNLSRQLCETKQGLAIPVKSKPLDCQHIGATKPVVPSPQPRRIAQHRRMSHMPLVLLSNVLVLVVVAKPTQTGTVLPPAQHGVKPATSATRWTTLLECAEAVRLLPGKSQIMMKSLPYWHASTVLMMHHVVRWQRALAQQMVNWMPSYNRTQLVWQISEGRKTTSKLQRWRSSLIVGLQSA